MRFQMKKGLFFSWVGAVIFLAMACRVFGFKGAVAPELPVGVTQIQGVPGPVHAVRWTPEGLILVATGSGLYRSLDQGQSWQRIFRSGIARGSVTEVSVDPLSPGRIYWVAAGALYVSESGQPGRRLLPRFQQVHGVEVTPGRIWVGTEQAVQVSQDLGATWRRTGEGIPAGPIHRLRQHPLKPTRCYAVTGSALFRSEDEGRSWSRLLSRPRTEEEDLKTEGESFLSEEGTGSERITDLVIDPATGDLLLGTWRGILVSRDEGRTWRRMREGLPAGPVRAVALDPEGKWLWVGTDRGAFKVPMPRIDLTNVISSPEGARDLALKNEISRSNGLEMTRGPAIQEVQEAAIRYAEVMPEKIQRWRSRAVLRNFFPRLTLGMNRDRDQTIVSATSGGKTSFTVGPEDKSLSLNLGFTWDLANLIWNPDQTSIDTRSRLTVQLRQEVLEEVTRLYFEWKRLGLEFEGNPTQDPTLQEERALRLAELTAQVDALTGGVFSQEWD